MKKSIYVLLSALALLIANPLTAQENGFLSSVNEKITSLEASLTSAEENFAALEAHAPDSTSLKETQASLRKIQADLTSLKEERDALAQSDEEFKSREESAEEQTKYEEDRALALQTLEVKTNSIEQSVSQVQTTLADSLKSSNSIANNSGSAVEIDVIPYVYQEAENGFILEVKLPDVEGTDEVKALSQQWIDHSNSRMELVKKQGMDWNKEKPSAPQYVWLANYNEYHNEELGVTSLVVNFYEYTGNLPGKEETQANLIKRDGTIAQALDLLSPSQVAYVQNSLKQQLKDDLARPADDLDKKHLSGENLDLSKGAVFFTEDSLEVYFPTGVLNSELGRPATLSLSLDEILKH